MAGDGVSGLVGSSRVVGSVDRCWQRGLCGLVAVKRGCRRSVVEGGSGGGGRT